MKSLITASILFFSASAGAHPGHLPVESVHGFLHIEHIVALAALGVIACIVSAMSGPGR